MSDLAGDIALHTLMEVGAALTALFIGVLALLSYGARKQNATLFLAVGFLGCGLLDAYHAVVTSAWFSQLGPSPPESLIPWSWNASRTFLAASMWIGCSAARREEELGRAGRVGASSVLWLGSTLTLATFLFFAFAFVPLPPAYVSDGALGRPGDLLAAALFAAALAGQTLRGRIRRDALELGLWLSLCLGVSIQALVMPFSTRVFDGPFDLAHGLKLASYACVLAGLLVTTSRRFHAAASSAEELGEANVHLRREVDWRLEAESQLRELTDRLETQVEKRTAELRAQQVAALNLAQDADLARRRVETTKAELRARTLELARSNQDLEQFAYIASHDLRAPLRAIASLVDWLEEDLGEELPSSSRKHLELMRVRVDRLQSLIEDLLRYSRAGRIDAEVEPVHAGELVEEIASLSNLPDGMAVVIGPDMPEFETARTPLQQVLRNLIGNALKHHDREQGRIEVSVREAGDFYEFEVSDDGPGLPPEYHERAFQIFQTLRPRDEVEGSGMGLALVKRIVERFGGAIELESDGKRGARFRFRWPRRIEQEKRLG